VPATKPKKGGESLEGGGVRSKVAKSVKGPEVDSRPSRSQGELYSKLRAHDLCANESEKSSQVKLVRNLETGGFRPYGAPQRPWKRYGRRSRYVIRVRSEKRRKAAAVTTRPTGSRACGEHQLDLENKTERGKNLKKKKKKKGGSAKRHRPRTIDCLGGTSAAQGSEGAGIPAGGTRLSAGERGGPPSSFP